MSHIIDKSRIASKIVSGAGRAQARSRAHGAAEVVVLTTRRRLHKDFAYEELPPGRYAGVVEKVRYTFGAATEIVVTYKLQTPAGTRRIEDRMLIGAPRSSVKAFRATRGLGRIESILRICGLMLEDVKGLEALPGLIEGTKLGVVTRNEGVARFKTPAVVRVEEA